MKATPLTCSGSSFLASWLSLVGFGIAIGWSYYPTFIQLANRWATDPQFSHGFLIPVVALLLLWVLPCKGRITSAPSGWGIVFLLAAGLLRLVGAFFYLDGLDSFSLLPAIAGSVLLSGGMAALRWSWPAIAYLIFMIPLPFQVETALSVPLQRVATVASTYALQTIGYPAVSEGNVIVIGSTRVGVAEACNGLGMLLSFFAISTAMALVVRRPWPDRLLLFLSAIPIGLLMNLIRITATGVAYQEFGTEIAGKIFHDVAGWLMMPMALLALWIELKLVDWMFVPEKETTPVSLWMVFPSPKQVASVQPLSDNNSKQVATEPEAISNQSPAIPNAPEMNEASSPTVSKPDNPPIPSVTDRAERLAKMRERVHKLIGKDRTSQPNDSLGLDRTPSPSGSLDTSPLNKPLECSDPVISEPSLSSPATDI